MSARIQSSTFAPMLGVMSAMFLAALDQSIVATAMPQIIADLHGFEHYAGIITSYMVASTVVVTIAGKLSDFYGRRLFLLFGVAEFVIASMFCGLAQNMTQLIIYRGLQGVGAGITQTMAFTTIGDLFPPAMRGRVAGLVGSVFAMSSVIGPAIGGFLTDGPGWRFVFLVNIPVGLFAFLVLYFYFPAFKHSDNSKQLKVDYAGAALLTLSVVPLLLALSWGGRDYAWGSSTILTLTMTAIIGTIGLLRVEKKASEPIIPLSIFKISVVAVAILGAGLVAVGMFGVTLFIPLFAQSVIGLSATTSGAVMIPMTLSLVSASMLGGQLISRTGSYRYLARAGLLVATLGMFLLSQMDATSTHMHVVRNTIILGFGFGMTMPVFSLAVQNAVPMQMLGAATATTQFVRSMGSAVGAAIFAALLVARFDGYFHTSLTPELLAHLPKALLESLKDPQSIMREGFSQTLMQMLDGFPDKEQAAHMITNAVKVGLGSALHDVFLFACMLLLIGFVVTFFLKDIPLRKSNHQVTSNSSLDAA